MTILPLLKTTFVAAAILYSGVGCAQAPLERMQAADTDPDGMIDKAEAEAKLPRIAKHFDKLDSNGDGKLSPEEFKATASKFAGRRR
jgi:hypothetical protein